MTTLELALGAPRERSCPSAVRPPVATANHARLGSTSPQLELALAVLARSGNGLTGPPLIPRPVPIVLTVRLTLESANQAASTAPWGLRVHRCTHRAQLAQPVRFVAWGKLYVLLATRVLFARVLQWKIPSTAPLGFMARALASWRVLAARAGRRRHLRLLLHHRIAPEVGSRAPLRCFRLSWLVSTI